MKTILKKFQSHTLLVLLLVVLFIIGFGSKIWLLENLGDKDLTGPDPYLFYREAYTLYKTGHLPQIDCMRYFPVCISPGYMLMVPYVGYFHAKLFDNSLYRSFIYSLTDLFKVTPIATNNFDLAIHYVIPIVFGISAIIFFLLAYLLFNRKKSLAIIATLFYILNPVSIFTSRISIFEKELIATPFILLTLLFYLLTKGNYRDKRKLNLKYSIIYGLSGLFTSLTFFTWGGWKLLPLFIGLTETIRVLRRENLNYNYTFYLVYTLIIFLVTKNPQAVSVFILGISLLPLFVIIFRDIYQRFLSKIELFERISSRGKEFLLKLKVDENVAEQLSKYTIPVLLLLIIMLPILVSKLAWVLTNPWLERFASSVAEQQPTTSSTFLSIFTPLIILLSIYVLWKPFRKDNIVHSLLGLLVALLPILVTVLIDLPVAIVWIVLMLYMIIFLLYSKKTDLETIFIVLFFLVSLIISDYILRLLFFLGYIIPIIIVYAIYELTKDIIKTIQKNNDKNKIIENLDLIYNPLFLISAISAIIFIARLYKANVMDYGSLIFLFMPIIAVLYSVFKTYLSKTKLSTNNRVTYLAVSLLLIYIFGIPYVYSGFIPLYYVLKGFGGTEKYLIDAMEWLKYNTPNDSIIAFWWDYGYYAQTIANRTTWLDGGNNIVYWNHLMGRYGLSMSEEDALRLLYVHSHYNFYSFLVLEMFGDNNAFYNKIYKKLNLTESDIEEINQLKKKLGNKWKDFVSDILKVGWKNFINEKRYEEYGLSYSDIQLLNNLVNRSVTFSTYYMIHPTDVGKSYQFTKIGSDENYDIHTWFGSTLFYSSMFLNLNDPRNREIYNNLKRTAPIIKLYPNNLAEIIFANNNILRFLGSLPMDAPLKLGDTFIPACSPELGITNCGYIVGIELVFSKNITKMDNNLKEELVLENINIDNIENGTVVISYGTKYYRVPLKCVYFEGEFKLLNKNGYGCLYTVPNSVLLGQIEEAMFQKAYFITPKAMNMLWVRLYFFENATHFKKVYDSFIVRGYPSIILDNQYMSPLKIWKVEFPNNFTVESYYYCVYLARNLREINMCQKIFNKSLYTSIWQV